MSKTKPEEAEEKRESGVPGGGAGRKDEIGRTGVYRLSGPHPAGDAPIVGMASWGQGSVGQPDMRTMENRNSSSNR